MNDDNYADNNVTSITDGLQPDGDSDAPVMHTRPADYAEGQDAMLAQAAQGGEPTNAFVRGLIKIGNVIFGTGCTLCAGIRGMAFMGAIWLITAVL